MPPPGGPVTGPLGVSALPLGAVPPLSLPPGGGGDAGFGGLNTGNGGAGTYGMSPLLPPQPAPAPHPVAGLSGFLGLTSTVSSFGQLGPVQGTVVAVGVVVDVVFGVVVDVVFGVVVDVVGFGGGGGGGGLCGLPGGVPGGLPVGPCGLGRIGVELNPNRFTLHRLRQSVKTPSVGSSCNPSAVRTNGSKVTRTML